MQESKNQYEKLDSGICSKTHKTGMTKDLEDSFLETDKSPNMCIMDKIDRDKGST